MLQALREKTSGWIAFVILASVSIPFAFFGINNYFERQSETYVAKVGDTSISPEDFRGRFEEYRQNARRQMGEQFDPSFFENPLLKRQLLDRMIDEEVLRQAAADTGAEASNALVRKEIAAIPAFQSNGAFDTSQYKLLLTSQNMSPRGFEERMRRDISSRELPLQVSATALVSDAEVDRFLRLRDQLRDFRYVTLPPIAPVAAEPSDADIQGYYDTHKDEFMSPEQVSLQYLELDAAALTVPTEADDATLKSRYDEQKSRFVVGEQRLASHVLIKVDANADAAAQKVALDKAMKLAVDARAGKDFADLAKANSDDIGSKSQGGDLGWVERNITQPAFETALFALNKGEFSDPVKTDEGYHVIWLRDVQPERAKSFDEAKPELAQEFVATERDRIYSETSGAMIDEILKDPSSLEGAAAVAKLEIKRTGLFGREGGEGIAANPDVVKVAFSDAVLSDGTVSDPVDVAPNHSVVIRIDEHKPKTPKVLEAVRAEIVLRIKAEAADKLADDRAHELEQRFVGGATLTAIADELKTPVSKAEAVGRSAVNHDATLLAEAFKLARPAEGAATKALVTLGSHRYALVEVAKVVDGDPGKADSAARDAVRQQLASGASNSETQAFIEALRGAFKIEIAEDRM